MTNEVENLIIKDTKKKELEFRENNAYLLYKEIWKFILYAKSFNYEDYIIRFDLNVKCGNSSINKSDGIKFRGKKDLNVDTWNTYHKGTDIYDVDNVLNTTIDIDLLFKLLKSDDFNVYCLKNEDVYLINVDISDKKVNDIIEGMMLKHRLVKELKGNYDRIY